MLCTSIIDIQYGNLLRIFVQGMLGGNGSVVQKAVAAELIMGSVMARRAAKAKGCAFLTWH